MSCARAFLSNWVARFGVPLHISSDRGSQFISGLWSAVAELLGTKIHHTTAYHPQANSLVERFHRTMKSAIKAQLNDSNWLDVLPWVLLGIRTAPKEDLTASSAELVYGAPLTVPGDFISDSKDNSCPTTNLRLLRERVGSLAPIPSSHHGPFRARMPAALNQAKFVFIRRDAHRSPLQRPYEGPFEVLQHGNKTFKVQIGNRSETISVDRLKPAHLDLDHPVSVSIPKPRGRPPIPKTTTNNQRSTDDRSSEPTTGG
uniref:uncharacterized protein LOC120337210 n=1 Tax=Styela clava TaxID=7725 RepID=UPI00193A6372|nr:uncharacterized protein LOC120337210 [Styela clava]